MKRKLLVLTPILALVLTGCFARSPLPATSGQSTSGSTTTTTTEPEEETYGTMDAPITVARAVEIAKEQYSDLKAKSFVDKDAYVKGVLKNDPIKSKDSDEYRFTVGDSYEATTTLDFYYGAIGEGVTMPVEGDSVVMFGRLLDVDGGTTIRLAGSESEQVLDPVVKKTEHVSYTLTLEKTGDVTVTDLPASAKSGDKVEFTVAPGTGYDIDEVLIDGIYDYASDNKYSFVVGHNTKVTVTAIQGLVKSDLRKAFEAGLELEGSAVTEAMTFKGTVVATSGNSFFLQDGKYGMYVYNKATEGIAVGKEVTVTSTIQNYNGTIETKSVSASAVTGYGTMPTAGEVTSLKSLATLRQNVLANAKNVKFITKDKEWSGSQTSIAKFDVNGETLTVKFEKYGYTATEGAVLNAAKEGDVLSIYSAVTTTNYGDPQLLFGSTSSFTKEVTPVVKPTTVTVTPATKEIHLDQKDVTLTATVGPEDADVKTVTWSSSHPLICDVDATTGLLDPKAISDTVVTITATSTANPDAKGTCAVTVTRVPVTSVAITETGPINLAVGGATATLHTTVLPENATDNSLTWSVEPTGIVTVADGVITPEAAGDATVTAASVSDPAKTASIAVHVSATETHVTDVVFNPTAKTIKIGDTFDLNTIVTVLPEEATNKNLTWESSSAAVTVNDGVIEGKAVTTSPVTITATSQDVTTVKGEIEITVEKIGVESIDVSPASIDMQVGDDDEALTIAFTPSNATNKEVTYAFEPTGVASIVDGKVHALVAGTTTLTITSVDNTSATDTCTITVTDVPSTYGTLDDPISTSAAIDIAKALPGEASKSVFADKDAYIAGVVTSNPSQGSSGDWIFSMKQTADASDTFTFRYGSIDAGVSTPKVGWNVVIFGRICVYNKTSYQVTAYNSVKPVVKKAAAPTPESIDISSIPAQVSIGSSIDLTGTILPSGAEGTLSWEITAGSSFATLSGNTLTGTAAGTVTIKATVVGTSITATKDITISATPTEQVVYTLDGTTTGSGSAYGDDNKITQNGFDWIVNGNTQMNPWRIGGKSLTDVDRLIYSETKMTDDITKVVLTHGTASNITVNSLTLIVSSNADFSSPISTLTGTFKADDTTTFERPTDKSWKDVYFKIVYNVTVSGTSNKFVQFISGEFYAVK